MIFELCINIQVVPVIKKVRRFPGNEIEQRHNSGQGENSKCIKYVGHKDGFLYLKVCILDLLWFKFLRSVSTLKTIEFLE